MLLLDTHALVWISWDDPRLGVEARGVIAKAFADSSLVVSAMSFWEAAMLSARGRLTMAENVSSWRAKVLQLGITEIPVTGNVAIAGGELQRLHRDPADRIIIATAIVHGAMLVTADRKILNWRSPLRRIDARR